MPEEPRKTDATLEDQSGKSRSPHDAFFKHTFQSAQHAARLLQTGLPPTVSERIDWGTLEQVPTEQVGE